MTLLYDTQSMFNRAITKIVRNPILLFVNLFTPLLFLLLFSQLLQKLGTFLGPTGNYLTYLTPGILVLNAVTGSFQSGMSIVNDINSGFLQKTLLTPVNRGAVLLGRLSADILVLLLQSAIIMGVASVLGLGVTTGFGGLLLIFVTVAFFGLAWSGLLLTVGLATRKAETVSAVGNLLVFPLIFISSALFPIAIMPLWARDVSNYNPLSYAANVIRDLIQGGLTWNTFAVSYAVIGFMAVVTFTATLVQFTRVIR